MEKIIPYSTHCYDLPTLLYPLLWPIYLTLSTAMTYLPYSTHCYDLSTLLYPLLWPTLQFPFSRKEIFCKRKLFIKLKILKLKRFRIWKISFSEKDHTLLYPLLWPTYLTLLYPLLWPTYLTLLYLPYSIHCYDLPTLLYPLLWPTL